MTLLINIATLNDTPYNDKWTFCGGPFMRSVFYVSVLLSFLFPVAAVAQTGQTAFNPQAQADAAARQAGELSVCEGGLVAIFPSDATIRNSSATMMGGANFGACALQNMNQPQLGGQSPFSLDSTSGKIVFAGQQVSQHGQSIGNMLQGKNACPAEVNIDKWANASCDTFTSIPTTSDGTGKYDENKLRLALESAQCHADRVSKARSSLECFQGNYERVRSSMMAFRNDLESKRECFGTYVGEVKGLQEKQLQRVQELDNRATQFSKAAERAQEMLSKVAEKEPQLNEALPALKQEKSRLYSALRHHTLSEFTKCVNGDAAYNSPLRRSRCLERSSNSKDGRKDKFERLDTKECLVRKFNEYAGGNAKGNIDKSLAGDKSSLFNLDLADIDATLESAGVADKVAVPDGADVVGAVSDAETFIQSLGSRVQRLEQEYGAFGKAYAAQYNWCMQRAPVLARKAYASETDSMGQMRMEYESKVRQVASDFRATAKGLSDTLKGMQKTLGVDEAGFAQHLKAHGCGGALQDPGKLENAATLETRKECIGHLRNLMEAVTNGDPLPDSNGQKMSVPIPGIADARMSPECRGMPNGCVCSGALDCANVYGQISTAVKQNADLMGGNGHYVDPSCTSNVCAKKPGIELTQTMANASISKAIAQQAEAYRGIAQANARMLGELNALLAQIPGAGRLGGFDTSAAQAFKCDTKDANGFCEMPDDFSSLIASTSGMPMLSGDAFETQLTAIKEQSSKTSEIAGNLESLKVACAKKTKKEEIVKKLDESDALLAEASENCEAYAEAHSPYKTQTEMSEIFSDVLGAYSEICVKSPSNLNFARKECTQFDREIRRSKRDCQRYANSAEERRYFRTSLQEREAARAIAAE